MYKKEQIFNEIKMVPPISALDISEESNLIIHGPVNTFPITARAHT